MERRVILADLRRRAAQAMRPTPGRGAAGNPPLGDLPDRAGRVPALARWSTPSASSRPRSGAESDGTSAAASSAARLCAGLVGVPSEGAGRSTTFPAGAIRYSASLSPFQRRFEPTSNFMTVRRRRRGPAGTTVRRPARMMMTRKDPRARWTRIGWDGRCRYWHRRWRSWRYRYRRMQQGPPVREHPIASDDLQTASASNSVPGLPCSR